MVFIPERRMNKLKLVNDWIVVNSKTHPDRVYYFNTKTKQSSWEEPDAQNLEQVTDSVGTSRKSKRRGKNVQSHIDRPVTPEYTDTETNTSKNRKHGTRKSNITVDEATKTEKETPQMIALREKIAKKKEQQLASKQKKKSKSNSSQINSSSISETGSTSKSPSSDTTVSTSSVEEKLTPQMQVLYEKMQQRTSIDGSLSRTKRKSGVEGGETPKRAGVNEDSNKSLYSYSSDDSSWADTNSVTSKSVPTRAKKKNVSINPLSLKTNRLQDVSNERRSRGNSTTSESSILSNISKSIFKKNLGKERLEKLRRSLELHRNSLEQTANSTARKSLGSFPNRRGAIPTMADIHKNVEVRLTRLKSRFGRNKISCERNSTQCETDKSDEVGQCSSVSTTVDDLVKDAVENAFCEEMDWEPLEDEEITFEVQAARNQVCTNIIPNLVSNIPNKALGSSVFPNQQHLYVVVDTNVFLSNISAIDLAREATFKLYGRPIIVVPWTVLRELDYIKDNKAKTKSITLRNKARGAIDYINRLFTSTQRVIGQTPEDVEKNKQKFAVDCPDDEILQTCLQIRDLGKPVVLLSYDKNLRTKAMIYNIVALGRHDFLQQMTNLNVDEANTSKSFTESVNLGSILTASRDPLEEIVDNIKSILKKFLEAIMSNEMHQLYGNYWKNYVIIPPPWTVKSVIKCAIKHWIAATSESFSRKAEPTLKELQQLFEKYPNSATELKNVEYLLEKCRDLVQMVNTEKHPDLMHQALEELDSQKQMLSEYKVNRNEQKIKELVGSVDNVVEQNHRAEKAFRFFEAAYAYARDMCGSAADLIGMPCSIPHEKPNPYPSVEYLKQMQPELAANVNKLLHVLGAVLEESHQSCISHRTLLSLHQTLASFLPENFSLPDVLTPLDVLCCVKQKEQLLKTGMRQLQELSTHFCRLASYKCT